MADKSGQGGTGTTPDLLLLSAEMRKAARLQSARAARAAAKGKRDGGLGFRLFLVLLAFTIVAAGFSLKVKALALPVLIVAEVEDRLNRMNEPAMPGARISLGGIDMMLGDDWAPVFRLQDLRLLQGRGTDTFLALPEASMALDAAALLGGRVQPQSLRISGAHLDLTRDLEGRINLLLGPQGAPAIQNLGEFFDRIDLALALPELSQLTTIEFDALSLTLFDERLQQSWELGDGRLVAENRPNELAAELAISFLDSTNAQARMVAVSQKGTGTARLRAEISDVPAGELAAQHPVLAWMSAVDAPISGQLSVDLHRGGIETLQAELSLGAGALQPSAEAAPIAFSKAGLKLSYDQADGRLRLGDITVQSDTLRASGEGQVFLLGEDGQILNGVLTARPPQSFVGQLTLRDVRIDPEGLFAAPLQFALGSLDMRLTPEPFLVEIGQFTLSDGDQKLTLTGSAGTQDGGWASSLDMAMNKVTVQKLMQLWPLQLVPRTRAWAARNLLNGDLSDVNGSIRIAPGTETRLHLDYDYAGADIQFMADMPPIKGGEGFSVIDGKVNTIFLAKGTVTPPEGGTLDMAGSSMRVLDIYAVPAVAEISLRGRGPAVAMLSILDRKPFEYLKKAGRPVALGQGDAVMSAEITTPLAKGVQPQGVEFTAEARVAGFQSSVLVEGRSIALPDMLVKADKTGMTAGGQGTIDGLPFDALYTLPFAADAGPAQITGTVEVSPRTVEVFDLGLPKGMVKGASTGQITLSLPKGAPPSLALTSTLQGTSLSIPELGWSKSSGGKARLEVDARLSSPPQVDRVALTAADLTATGTVDFRDDGRLEVARFDRVTMGGWLDGAVEIRGSTPLSFSVTSGAIDFRKFPSSEQRQSGPAGAAAGSPLKLKLSEFRVTDSIRLNDFRGDFTLGRAGVNGQFSAMLGGSVAITGGVAPEEFGTGVRVVATDAGAALQAAGIFDSARGGSVDLRLIPRAQPGIYDGRAIIREFKVKNANVLADLLNAISVIGLLEQLNGSGIVFNKAEADFVLQPTQVTVTQSSAIGASMGVSMEGTYQTETGKLRMGGVLSPIYLLNGIGAIFTRKGEGLFGFSYRLGGTADDPTVGVNPLSILTPGMFRDIFRIAPPKAEGVAP